MAYATLQRAAGLYKSSCHTIIIPFSLVSAFRKKRIKTRNHRIHLFDKGTLTIRLLFSPLPIRLRNPFGCIIIRKLPGMRIAKNRFILERSPRNFSHKIARNHRKS